MEIKRDSYIEKLKNRMHNGMIKVITGIRRSGKSYLLLGLFRDFLLQKHCDSRHIITLELDRLENREYRNPTAALNYIKDCIHDDLMHYVLLDEVQMLDSFVDVLNSLLHIKNVDVYVTGSNSRLLSNDILTEFRGRGDEIHVYPLSFKEFLSAYEGDRYQAWADYSSYGGLPLIPSMKTEEQKVNYLVRLFSETYIKDIVERNRIEKLQELNDLINVLASSIGSLTNPSKILASFQSSIKSDISLNTIRSYIEHLKNAFLIHEADRYDVKGRKYIGSPLKYYFEDIGLRNARLSFRQLDESHIMENIVFNELRLRDFQVDVGMVTKRYKAEDGRTAQKNLEVDFIANKGSRRYYLQSALIIPNEEKLRQENASLSSINDSFKKIILVKDIINVKRDDRGIITMSIFDFLLNPDSLEL